MQRFQNILLASKEECEDASTLRMALSLAERSGARLTVARVVPDYAAEPYWDEAEAGHLFDDARDQLASEVRLAAPDSPVAAEIDLLVGTPSIEITQSVLRRHCDLLIVTAERQEGVRERLFGSTIMNLMRKCPVPVWAFKQGGADPRCVMATLDTYEADDVQRDLDRAVLELAASLAESVDAALVIAQGWEVLGESLLRSRGRVKPEELERIRATVEAENREQLDRFLADFDLSGPKRVTTRLVKGTPGHSLTALAQREGVDVIVMGTIARTGIPGLLMGNTAERILQNVDCSVLAVKPEGFSTPVERD